MEKPGDFMLGVLDFFAVLLPGTIATWLLLPHLPANLREAFRVGSSEREGLVPAALYLFMSYGLGHFVFGLSSKLDTSYDAWRRTSKRTDTTFQLATRAREQVTPHFVDDQFSTLKWARALIGIRNPAARLEIDRLEATSKFFRSMVVVSILLVLHFLLVDPNQSVALGAVALGWLSFWRFCDQRFKMTELAYATAIIIATVGAPATSTPPGEGANGGSDEG